MTKKLLTRQQEEFVINNYKDRTNKEVTELLNKKFNTDFEVEQIRAWKRNRKLTGGKKDIPQSKLFPKEVQEYIREIAVGRYKAEITELVNEKFGTNYEVKQIKSWVKRKKINTGLTGRFSKGHEPYNKGKRTIEQSEKMKQTQFKKGHRPHNTLKVGDTVTTKDGYIKIKVAEPNKWKFLHRKVWEEHNGPIKPGMRIIFLDNDRTNCDISNLAMVDKQEAAILHTHGLRFDRAEATATAVALAKVIVQSRRRKNEKSKV